MRTVIADYVEDEVDSDTFHKVCETECKNSMFKNIEDYRNWCESSEVSTFLGEVEHGHFKFYSQCLINGKRVFTIVKAIEAV